MKYIGLAVATACLLSYSLPVMADDAAAPKDVTGPSAAKLMQNPADWVEQRGDYANTGYSKLDQITNKNVKNLQVAWTFSTGVLRGH